MREKPWPIVVLAILQILTPIGNFILNLWLYHLPPSTVGLILSHFTIRQWWESIFLMPVAGLALLQVKPWSYPIFLIAIAWSAYANFRNALIHPEAISWLPLMFAYALNLGLVSYFSIGAIRSLYFEKRRRWWESKPRYTLPLIEATLRGLSDSNLKSIPVAIRNLSEGGLSLDSNQRDSSQLGIISGSPPDLEIRFSFFQKDWSLTGRIAHSRKLDAETFILGFAFTGLTVSQRVRLRHLVSHLEFLGIPSTRSRTRSWSDFYEWIKTKGLRRESWFLPLWFERILGKK